MSLIPMIKFIKTDPLAKIPYYATPGSSGMDVSSIEEYYLQPFERKLFKTGLKVEIPKGYEIQVRPRSGLALKYGITVLNTPGTVDFDFIGEIGVILFNTSNEEFCVVQGMRIAQLVVAESFQLHIEESTEPLTQTKRGTGGFGSTGL